MESLNATKEEVVDFMAIVDKLMDMIEEANGDDYYGTQGWKYTLGWEG